jgi:environmental stress-induced protein Ves
VTGVQTCALPISLRWRVSAADITQPGDFSVFDGIDRTAVLLQGPGLALQAGSERWVFEGVGAVAQFPGELPLHATLGASGAARLWNVMTDRATMRAQVRVGRHEQAHIGLRGDAVLLVHAGTLGIVLDNALDDAPPLMLSAGEGLVLTAVQASLQLRDPDGAAHWILTTFHAR